MKSIINLFARVFAVAIIGAFLYLVFWLGFDRIMKIMTILLIPGIIVGYWLLYRYEQHKHNEEKIDREVLKAAIMPTEPKEQGSYEKFKHPSCDSLYCLQKCDICGCTDNNACPGGCSWSAPNLCSSCVSKAVEQLMCADCTLTQVAKIQASCSSCEHTTCAHTCAFEDEPDQAPPLSDEAPSCETWECKQRPWCEWAFITGFVVQKNHEISEIINYNCE